MKKPILCILILVVVLFVIQACFFNNPKGSSNMNFKVKSDAMYESINNNFYDKDTNLYYETIAGKLGLDEKQHSYLWPLSALYQADAEKFIMDGSVDTKLIENITKSTERYYNNEYPPKPGYDSYVVSQGGGQRYYDDNQWLGLTFCDLYEQTKNAENLNKAIEIYDFAMTGYDDKLGGGLYWREGDKTTKNTCSNGPQIVLALRLYMLTDKSKPEYLKTANDLYDWVNKNLKSPENVYWDNIKTNDGSVDKTTWTYNTGIMIHANVLFYEITKDKSYLTEAQSVASAGMKHFAPDGNLPGTLWFNAVMLRGYKELYKVDGNRAYITTFEKFAEDVFKNERNPDNNIIGLKDPKTLIDQAAMLEICSSLATVK